MANGTGSTREFTLRALLLGLFMAVVLGAANAYLGIRAGQTVAATFPAAVVSMVVIRGLFKGSLLEENIARTTASVGEALAAGAIFTLPAFLMAGAWEEFNYWESTLLMLIGGLLGILFVVILRRSMVTDPELPFPESVAAAEIHRAGKGASGGRLLFQMMGVGALIEVLKNSKGIQLFTDRISGALGYGSFQGSVAVGGQSFGAAAQPGVLPFSTPAASPAYLGVGYIIGFRLSALVFSGGVFAWWFMIPAVLFFNPEFADAGRLAAAGADWTAVSSVVWAELVRPIAVGAMIAGAIWTLLRMRKSLGEGLKRSIGELKTGHPAGSGDEKDRDIPFSWTTAGVVALIIPTFFLYNYYTGQPLGALGSAIVMIVAGFFFSAVAGYLVGVVGSSSNPVSGLTISTLLLAALLMTFLGVTGTEGVTAVLGVAAVVCCACAVAGDMLQDLKVGQILGGTPFRMEWAEIIGVVFASMFLVLPMMLLHQGDIAAGGIGIGGEELPAPQAGLMALLSQGIVGGDMRWPLVVFGIALCLFLILIQAPSPMLIAVGMYLPLQTTFAIFVGGFFRWLSDRQLARLPAERRTLGESAGTLIASGLIAGEALMGVGLSGFAVAEFQLPMLVSTPSGIPGFLVFVVLGWFLIRIPLRHAKGQG
ncbi:MAG: oligopeptide transporter, OPT family [Acidobacteriota bacterium]|nr:oligopeptide transporter, OPT family [Acidobacteriota bacterium]